MNPLQLLQRFFRRGWKAKPELPKHLRRGKAGETAARCYLRKKGMKFLTANYRSSRGEIDLIFRDRECLVFVEVKTRSSEIWVRPAHSVNPRKKRILSRVGMDYLRKLPDHPVIIRYDIVEVLLNDRTEQVEDLRHLPDAFRLSAPYRYG